MALQIRKLSETWYTPIKHREEDNPPRFLLKTITQEQLEEVQYNLTDTVLRQKPVFHPSAIKLLLIYGLKDFDNIQDEEGNPKSFNRESVSNIDIQIRNEVAVEIYRMSNLSEEEKKT